MNCLQKIFRKNNNTNNQQIENNLNLEDINFQEGEESQQFENLSEILLFNGDCEEDKKQYQINDENKTEIQKSLSILEQRRDNLNKNNYKDLQIEMKSLETSHLDRLKEFLLVNPITSKLKILFESHIFDQEIQIQKFISLLSNIRIMKQLTIEINFTKLISLNIINLAIELCKKQQIESFKLILTQSYSIIYSFEIFSKSENGQSLAQQLGLIKSKLKKNIYSYSILSRILNFSHGVFVRNFYLNRQILEFTKLNDQQELLLSKQVSKLYELDEFDYDISFNENNYKQLFSLNLIISSIKNLNKLNLKVDIDQINTIKQDDNIKVNSQSNIQFEKQRQQEQEQQQNEFLKIRQISRQNENIKQAQIMIDRFNMKDTDKINIQFKINVLKQIIWSINKVLDLQIIVPFYLLEHLSNEIYQLQQLQTLKFSISCENLNHEFTEKLGLSLAKLQNLKKLSIEIEIKKVQSQGINISHNFVNLPCQKEIMVSLEFDHFGFSSYDDQNKEEEIFKKQAFESIKEILKLNNIYFFQFNLHGYEEEIFDLFKSTIKSNQNLQTVKFCIGGDSSIKNKISWNSEEKKQYRMCGFARNNMYQRKMRISQIQTRIIKNNSLKKAIRLVKIDVIRKEE